MFRPVIALAIYLAVQIVCSIPLVVMAALDTCNTGQFALPVHTLSWSLLASSVITVLLLHAFKFINIIRTGAANLKHPSTTLAIASLILLMFASSILTEWMQLDNIMAEQFMAMAHTVPGILAIGIIGPIAEEYVFREAIMGGMLSRGAKPWTACIISALIFGLVHGNPAQIPFAFLAGLAFGVVYMHTRSVIPVIICHIINNSTSVILMNIYSDNPDIGLRDIMGHTTSIYVCILSLAAGLILLRLFMKQKQKEGIPHY